MKPLYTITFLVPAALLEAATTCVPATCRIGICVDDAAALQVDNIYQTLFLKPAKYAICLVVPAHALPDEKLQDALLVIFNHPQYAIVEKRPEVILIQEHEAANTKLPAIETFQAKAQAQGWAGVYLTHFFKSPYGVQKEAVFSLTVPSIAAVKSFFSANEFADISAIAGAHFLIQVADVQLIPLIQSMFAEMEQAAIHKNPKIYDVYLQLKQTKEELYKTKEQLQFSHKQLNSLKRYNAILKSEDQTRRILEFYHSQYEVLPLWYKRFGHILKVLSGKRTLRSLFDDSVKKEPT